MHTPERAIPTGGRVPHPAEAAAGDQPLTAAQMRWQRVLEVVAHREPWVEMYLRGSRIEYADNREVHYSVVGEVAVRVLNSSPSLDVIHEAVREVTGRRRHPVAHLSSVTVTSAEREQYRADMAKASSFAVAQFDAQVVT